VKIDPEVHTLVWPNGADFDPATFHGNRRDTPIGMVEIGSLTRIGIPLILALSVFWLAWSEAACHGNQPDLLTATLRLLLSGRLLPALSTNRVS
jgi:hypothetical protein